MLKPFALAFCGVSFCYLLFSCKKQIDPNIPPTSTDSFIVTVNNGYGSGKYRVGDTVHIFSAHYGSTQIFDQWSGDISLLNGPEEWHTWFIMPDKNVSFSGSIKTINSFNLKYETIKGRDRQKPVYYFLSPGNKGLVYLLHGTSGTAAYLVAGFEFQQLIKSLVNDNFGVIVTEAEEATTGVDANADGKLRWALLPMDSALNVDYANIKAITDTFYNRGLINHSQPRYSVGMSDGGFFSVALSYMYHFKAGVNYCAQGSEGILQITTVPTQFCMARNDNNSSVGSVGNADALTFSKNLMARGICSKYFINERSPIYPERFARTGVISTTQSISIFNELQSKGYIDNKRYFIGYSDAFLSALQSNPLSFPIISSLSLSQKMAVLEQINLSVSDHHMYSDYDRATLRFFNSQCN